MANAAIKIVLTSAIFQVILLWVIKSTTVDEIGAVWATIILTGFFVAASVSLVTIAWQLWNF